MLFSSLKKPEECEQITHMHTTAILYFGWNMKLFSSEISRGRFIQSAILSEKLTYKLLDTDFFNLASYIMKLIHNAEKLL